MLVNVIRFYAARLLHISPSDIGVFLRPKKRELNRLKLFNQKKVLCIRDTHRQQMQPSSCVTHSIFNAVRQSRSSIIFLSTYTVLYTHLKSLKINQHSIQFQLQKG
jgi:hypothetical protein